MNLELFTENHHSIKGDEVLMTSYDLAKFLGLKNHSDLMRVIEDIIAKTSMPSTHADRENSAISTHADREKTFEKSTFKTSEGNTYDCYDIYLEGFEDLLIHYKRFREDPNNKPLRKFLQKIQEKFRKEKSIWQGSRSVNRRDTYLKTNKNLAIQRKKFGKEDTKEYHFINCNNDTDMRILGFTKREACKVLKLTELQKETLNLRDMMTAEEHKDCDLVKALKTIQHNKGVFNSECNDKLDEFKPKLELSEDEKIVKIRKRYGYFLEVQAQLNPGYHKDLLINLDTAKYRLEYILDDDN